MVPLRFAPVWAPFVQRLIGPGQPETEVLQPPEVQAVQRPAALPGMLDRVTGTDEHSTLDFHLGAALETSVTHDAVLRRTWRRALVRRSGFTTWRKRERYGTGIAAAELLGPITPVPVLRYCHRGVAWQYFGHWLTDSIPSALIEPETGSLWMPHNPAWSHSPDYAATLSLPLLPDRPVLADELITYQDYSQGSHKIHRYQLIRDALQARYGSPGETMVYIRRGRSGAPRWIANEDSLVEQLVARNWRILDIVGTSVEEIQRTLCPARVVVSIDGSHVDHAHLSLRPGSAMVMLVPRDRFTMRQVGPSRAHGVKPGYVVLNGSVETGYAADPDEVLRTVDLAMAMA